MEPLIFLGAGGTSFDVLGLIDDINARQPAFRPIGYLDDFAPLQGATLHGLPVLGFLSDHARFPDALFVNCLGSPRNYTRRGSVVEALAIPEGRFATVVHPSAVISRMATIGTGTIVYPYAFVGAAVHIGRQALVMSHTSVNHEATIGDYAIVASGAVLLGKVHVGSSAYVGAGAVIRQNVRVGPRALVGMGSTVIKDVEHDTVVIGTPARLLRTNGPEAERRA